MTDFSLLQTPNYFGGAVNALQAGQQARQQRDRRSALADYGTNPDGARNALLAAGDVETVGQLQGLEANKELVGQRRAAEGRAVASEEREATTAKLKQAATLNSFMLDGVQAVSQIPQEQRDAYFTSTVAPRLLEMGVPEDALKRIAAAPKDDATLRAFGTALGKEAKDIEYQFINLGDGGIARGRKDTGEVITVREPAPKPFAMDPDKTYVDISPSGGSVEGARGTRNNNPGNIEDGSFAKSLPGYKGSDGRFAIFETPEQGSNAQVALLQSYGKRGFDTPMEIIGRWAPPSDGNDTTSYANFIAKELGVPVDEELNLSNPKVAQRVADAIAKFESGGQSASNGAGAGAGRVLQTGKPKNGYRPATPEEKAEYGIPANVPAQISADGKIDVVSLPKGEADPARAGRLLEARKAQAQAITSTVDGALKRLGKGEAGYIGKTMSEVPGTKAYDLARDIETIKANLGFQELAEMRANSPTGGALGAIAVQELTALQSTVANLDIGQSEGQLRKNLQKIKSHYAKWEAAANKAEGSTTAESTALPQQAASQLKAGQNTTFANGQTWTLRGGKPERVN